MKLPDKLAARRDGEATAYELATGPVGYRNGFNAGAAEVLAMAEKLVEALSYCLRDDTDTEHYGCEVKAKVYKKSEARKALVDWEAWKGDDNG